MKSFFTVIFIFSMLVTLGQAKVSIENDTYDFGTFKEGADSTCVFTVKNVGTSPLIIISVSKPCGCTQPSFTKAPILPGETGKVTVVYRSNGHPGTFTKRMQVRTNDPKKEVTIITIRGNAVAKEKSH